MTKFDKFCNKVVHDIDKKLQKAEKGFEKGIKKIEDKIREDEINRRTNKEYKKMMDKISEETGFSKKTIKRSFNVYGYIIVGSTILFAVSGVVRNLSSGPISTIGGAIKGTIGGFLYGVFSPITIPVSLLVAPFYAK
jgi:hypothetical protein